jgi:hypothetical protein
VCPGPRRLRPRRDAPPSALPGPRGEVGGDVRGEDPSLVDLPGFRREVPQAHGLRGADAVGLDGGVVAVQHVDELRVVAARNAGDSAAWDVRVGGTRRLFT